MQLLLTAGADPHETVVRPSSRTIEIDDHDQDQDHRVAKAVRSVTLSPTDGTESTTDTDTANNAVHLALQSCLDTVSRTITVVMGVGQKAAALATGAKKKDTSLASGAGGGDTYRGPTSSSQAQQRAQRAAQDCRAVLRVLGLAGVDMARRGDHHFRYTPLHLAALSGCGGCVAVVREFGGDLEETDASGARAVHLAARRVVVDSARYGRVLRVLVKLGANVWGEDGRGETVESVLRRSHAGELWARLRGGAEKALRGDGGEEEEEPAESGAGAVGMGDVGVLEEEGMISSPRPF